MEIGLWADIPYNMQAREWCRAGPRPLMSTWPNASGLAQWLTCHHEAQRPNRVRNGRRKGRFGKRNLGLPSFVRVIHGPETTGHSGLTR